MTSPNALLAPTVEGPVSSWAGLSLVEDVDQVRSGISGGSWVDTSLGGVSAGLDALAFVTDPVGTLLQYGIAWLIEHVKPLSEALDWLAGDPAEISAQSQTWRNMSAALSIEADELIRSVHWDTSEWLGEAGDAYREWSTNQQNALTALSRAGDAMATAVAVAGELIAGVRIMVRDAIAMVVGRLISYALEEIASLGLATPLLVTQVSTLCAQWSSRIARWLHGLVDSIHRLRTMTDQLATLFLEKDADDWERVMSDAGIPCGMVRRIEEVAELAGPNSLVPLTIKGLPDGERVQIPGTGFRDHAAAPPQPDPPPALDGDRVEILRWLGMSPEGTCA